MGMQCKELKLVFLPVRLLFAFLRLEGRLSVPVWQVIQNVKY